jgi:hypothetical protein
MTWNPIGPKPKLPNLPPIKRVEQEWINKLAGGKWAEARRVITCFKFRSKHKILKHLSSWEVSRFHEDEAVTNRMGVTERGTDERGILYCRLTEFGQELSRVWFTKEAQQKWNLLKGKEDPDEAIVDAIFR